MRAHRLLLPALVTAFACSGRLDSTQRFVGKWTYQPGSAIQVDCPNMPTQTMDLSSVPPANQPGSFTFWATSVEKVHEVDAGGCQYNWDIEGDVATAEPEQSCATFPDGRGGNRVVHLQSGTKTTRDGASIAVDERFSSDDGCAIHAQAVATKS